MSLTRMSRLPRAVTLATALDSPYDFDYSRRSGGVSGLGDSPGHWAHREPAPHGEPAL
jgi:hypothetical protein